MSLPLHVERSGAGPPLVLWHGWGMNLRCFDALRAALHDEYEVIAIDLPGHGRSGWQSEWAREDWLSLLLHTIPSGARLLGWSLGGQFALRAAKALGTSLSALVLCNSTPRFAHAADWPHGLPDSIVQRFNTQLQQDYRQAMRDFLELQLRGDSHADARRAQLQQALLSHGEAHPEALRTGLDYLLQHDLREHSRTLPLSVPVLLLAGENDRITSPRASAAWSELLPNASLLRVPRCAHALPLQIGAEWLPALRQFLSGASIGAAT